MPLDAKTQKLFAAAQTEVQYLKLGSQCEQNFTVLLQLDWINNFQAGAAISYEDYNEKAAKEIIYDLIGWKVHFDLKQADDAWPWQLLVQRCAQQYLPFTSFAILIVADRLFASKLSLDDFYPMLDRQNLKPYQEFIKQLCAKSIPAELVDYYATLKHYLPTNTDTQEFSDSLQKIVVNLYPLLPDPKPGQKNIAPVAPKQHEAAWATEPNIAVANNTASPPLDRDVFFRFFTMSPEIRTLCTLVYHDLHDEKNILPEQRILEVLQGVQGQRDRFIMNLVILHWSLQKKREKDILHILKSLWDMVYQLAARGKQEINLESTADNILLAEWEPCLYITLLDLTLRALENSDSFFLAGPQKQKFDKATVEKLKSHAYYLGYRLPL